MADPGVKGKGGERGRGLVTRLWEKLRAPVTGSERRLPPPKKMVFVFNPGISSNICLLLTVSHVT